GIVAVGGSDAVCAAAARRAVEPVAVEDHRALRCRAVLRAAAGRGGTERVLHGECRRSGGCREQSRGERECEAELVPVAHNALHWLNSNLGSIPSNSTMKGGETKASEQPRLAPKVIS